AGFCTLHGHDSYRIFPLFGECSQRHAAQGIRVDVCTLLQPGDASYASLQIFALYMVMILTGFSLYSESAPSGMLHKGLGWMFALFSNQGMRLTHHCGMWLLIGFAIHHVYSAWLMDIKEKGGVMS